MMDKILNEALLAKDLILTDEIKRADAYAGLTVPADYGEHEPIPEEAVTVDGVVSSPTELKVTTPSIVGQLKDVVYIDVSTFTGTFPTIKSLKEKDIT